MRPQVGPIGERLSTMSTPEGLVPRVGSKVALQQPWSGKRLSADSALVGEVVSEDVHGEGWHAHVHLATN